MGLSPKRDANVTLGLMNRCVAAVIKEIKVPLSSANVLTSKDGILMLSSCIKGLSRRKSLWRFKNTSKM